jgi:DNA-binding NtrC family response regulator
VEILIVDDEPHIRLAVATMLLKQGHKVIEAANGLDALQALHENRSITVVICDMRLPDIEGEQLVEVIKAKHPQVRIIVTSVFDSRLWDACQRGADHKLLKPFSRREFLNVFGEVVPGARAYAASF